MIPPDLPSWRDKFFYIDPSPLTLGPQTFETYWTWISNVWGHINANAFKNGSFSHAYTCRCTIRGQRLVKSKGIRKTTPKRHPCAASLRINIDQSGTAVLLTHVGEPHSHDLLFMDQRGLNDGLRLIIEHLAPILKSTKAIKDGLLTGPDRHLYALAGAEHVTLGRIRYAAIDTLFPDKTREQRALQDTGSGDDDADAGEDESMHDSNIGDGDQTVVENESVSPSFQLSETFVSSSSTGVIQTDLASAQPTVSLRGIVHGLPSLPPEATGLTAIVIGANGISGHYMLRVLGRNPKRWKRVYCLSRRPPYGSSALPPNAEHISVDFLAQPDEIAAQTTLFFFSYIHPVPNPDRDSWSTAQEVLDTNSAFLSNFLSALPIASIIPRRFLLQTGAKTYGVHLVPTKLPQEESDPRVLLRPDFYYAQEDVLSAFSEKTGCASNVCIPGPITDAVLDAAMNYAYPLAIYAAACAKLGEHMVFPGDTAAWQMSQSRSYALMNAYMEEWAVLAAPTGERFNTCDGSSFTWEGAWPVVAEWYAAQSVGPWDGDQYHVQQTRLNPRSYGANGVMRRKFTMINWAATPEVKRAWTSLAREYKLKPFSTD
ncbi:hypothetical protein LTR95_001699 [Oleoguttula sp. CCFEE 5521]